MTTTLGITALGVSLTDIGAQHGAREQVTLGEHSLTFAWLTRGIGHVGALAHLDPTMLTEVASIELRHSNGVPHGLIVAQHGIETSGKSRTDVDTAVGHAVPVASLPTPDELDAANHGLAGLVRVPLLGPLASTPTMSLATLLLGRFFWDDLPVFPQRRSRTTTGLVAELAKPTSPMLQPIELAGWNGLEYRRSSGGGLRFLGHGG